MINTAHFSSYGMIVEIYGLKLRDQPVVLLQDSLKRDAMRMHIYSQFGAGHDKVNINDGLSFLL